LADKPPRAEVIQHEVLPSVRAAASRSDPSAPIRVYQWPCLISGLVAVAIRLRPMAVSQLPSSTSSSIGQSS
jgi:hypothetical protein